MLSQLHEDQVKAMVKTQEKLVIVVYSLSVVRIRLANYCGSGKFCH